MLGGVNSQSETVSTGKREKKGVQNRTRRSTILKSIRKLVIHELYFTLVFSTSTSYLDTIDMQEGGRIVCERQAKVGPDSLWRELTSAQLSARRHAAQVERRHHGQ